MSTEKMPFKQFMAVTLIGGMMTIGAPVATALVTKPLLEPAPVFEDSTPRLLDQKVKGVTLVDVFDDGSLIMEADRNGETTFRTDTGRIYEFAVDSLGRMNIKTGDTKVYIERPTRHIFRIERGDDTNTIDLMDFMRHGGSISTKEQTFLGSADGGIMVSEGSAALIGSNGGRLVFDFGSDDDDSDAIWDFKFEWNEDQFEEMVDGLEDAMDELREELQDSDSWLERKSLEQALKSLEANRRELERNRDKQIKRGERVFFSVGDVVDREIKNALTEVNKHTIELRFLSEELREELDDARKEVRDALRDLEVNVTSEEGRSLRIRLEKEANDALGELEERQLEAIKRAEDELKRARERLEKRIAEKEKALAKAKKDSKD